jgi:ribosome maturation factor RimP
MGLPDSVKMSQLRQVAEAVVKDNFLELFDLVARPQGGKTLLSVVLDKTSGKVSLEECVAVSGELEKRLDELDVMEGSYLLEVSSPGMDRPLRHGADYVRFEGRLARMTLTEPQEGLVSFEGRLGGLEEDRVLIRIGRERTLRVPLAVIKSARLVVEL